MYAGVSGTFATKGIKYAPVAISIAISFSPHPPVCLSSYINFGTVKGIFTKIDLGGFTPICLHIPNMVNVAQ
jgi:hypothetical protein